MCASATPRSNARSRRGSGCRSRPRGCRHRPTSEGGHDQVVRLRLGVLLWVFHASTNESLFHTGWFVESLATQTLVVFVIRTQANPLKSQPSRPLLVSVLAVVVIAIVLPYTPLGSLMRFTPLPISLLGAIAVLTVTYLFIVQAVKSWFYRRHALL